MLVHPYLFIQLTPSKHEAHSVSPCHHTSALITLLLAPRKLIKGDLIAFVYIHDNLTFSDCWHVQATPSCNWGFNQNITFRVLISVCKALCRISLGSKWNSNMAVAVDRHLSSITLFGTIQSQGTVCMPWLKRVRLLVLHDEVFIGQKE